MQQNVRIVARLQWLLTLLLLGVTHLSWGQCTHPDYNALISFYNGTQGYSWNTKTNWLKDCEPCSWYGVTCDATKRVSKLKLINNGLNGSIPNSFSALTNLQILDLSNNYIKGSIPTSLSTLTNLQSLNLSYNSLNSSIPASLSALTNLNSFNLKVNELTGSIPNSLSALTNLKTLDLGYNKLTGSIPTSLSALTSLDSLNLTYNGLTGTIPSSLSALTTIKFIDLSRNRFLGLGLTGSIPISFSALTNLQSLDLNNNNLSGNIPVSLSSLTNLTYLNLSGNSLTGSIPASLGTLSHLDYLILDNNQLSGCLPASLSTLCGKTITISANPGLPAGGNFNAFCTNSVGSCSPPNLLCHPDYNALFYLYSLNNGPNWTRRDSWLTDCDPCGWYGIACDGNGRVSELHLGSNQLTGTITDSLYSLTNLQILDLSGNYLTGSIPASLSALISLQELNLDYTSMTGSIPSSLGALINLRSLSLRGNKFSTLGRSFPALSGAIPTSLGALVELQTLDLSNNSLSGSIPDSFSALTNLQNLNLGDDGLSGSIPPGIGNFINLQNLNLGANGLSGSIPSNLGNLINLRTLRLGSNQLSGSIPPSLGNLINLKELYLNHNQLTGNIPFSLGNLTNIEVLFLSFNYGLNGCIPSSLSVLCGKNVDLSQTYLGNYGDFTAFCASGIGACSSALPINLVSFSAKAINDQAVNLTWTTASEQNNDYFLLERSKDLAQIEPLAKIKAQEGASFQGYTYTCTDEKAYAGTSYYRLKQIDLDGKTTTYPWELVILRQQAYGVSPNPITYQRFSVQLDEPQTALVKLYTLEGRSIPLQKVGSSVDSLELKTEQKLSAGIYILTVEERGQTRRYRLVAE